LTEVRETQHWNAKIPTIVTGGESTFFNFMRPLRFLCFNSTRDGRRTVKRLTKPGNVTISIVVNFGKM
jgi:hypothetical protein